MYATVKCVYKEFSITTNNFNVFFCSLIMCTFLMNSSYDKHFFNVALNRNKYKATFFRYKLCNNQKIPKTEFIKLICWLLFSFSSFFNFSNSKECLDNVFFCLYFQISQSSWLNLRHRLCQKIQI